VKTLITRAKCFLILKAYQSRSLGNLLEREIILYFSSMSPSRIKAVVAIINWGILKKLPNNMLKTRILYIKGENNKTNNR